MCEHVKIQRRKKYICLSLQESGLCKNYTCVEKRTSEIYIRYVCIFRAVKKYTSVFFYRRMHFCNMRFFYSVCIFLQKHMYFLHDVCIFRAPGNKYIRFFYNVTKNKYVLEKNPYVFFKYIRYLFYNGCTFSKTYVFFLCYVCVLCK